RRNAMANAAELQHEDRPWEAPGAVRRDCEPHRAHLIRLIGAISLTCGLLSICFGLTAIPATVAAMAAWNMANSDLRKMSRGLMDPSGRETTTNGKECAQAGVGFSIICGGMWILILIPQLCR